MDFLKELFDSFIPHADNGYKPHFFRLRSMLIVATIIAVFGAGGLILQKTIIEKSDYLAAVINATLVNLANADRQTNNLQYLAVNPVLERAAQLKAEDMAKKSYFAHTSPEGLTPWHWFKEAGYTFVYAGENLAVRFSDSVDVERAWMNSPGHRANILNTHFKEIGIGIAEGLFEGQPTIFVVQMFGAPATSGSKFPVTAVKPVATTTQTIASTTPPQGSGQAVAGEKAPVAPKPVAVKGVTVEEEVLSESEEVPVQSDPEPLPKIILENETFIAVKNEMATNSPLAALAVSPDTSISLAQKLITSPKSVVEAIYLVLTAIITLALIVMIVVEVKRQHPKNVALGVSLLLLMAGMLYLGQVLSPGSLLIL